jgi:hypothetical protein
MAQIFDKENQKPQRKLTFSIEVTDEGVTSGTALRHRRKFQGWKQIGTLTFDNAVIFWNGDSVTHFNHPTWRSDRNHAATATQVPRLCGKPRPLFWNRHAQGHRGFSRRTWAFRLRQWFTESQFESYRRVGQFIGEQEGVSNWLKAL